MRPNTNIPLVRVERLTKTYPHPGSAASHRGAPPGVRDVSFDIGAGQTLGVVGPSGAGKTTLGRAVLRLVEPTAGRVTMTMRAGETVDVTTLSPRDLRRFRRHMQMIFQDPYTSLDPRLTIRQVLREPLRLHRIGGRDSLDTRLDALLDKVSLDPAVLDDLPSSLSGGQRQRVGIARAIACLPRFVVADEPVTALDMSVQAQILNLMRDLQEELGLSYLFISHDVAVVAHLSDTIAVLSDGEIVEHGETDAVLTQPAHPVTQALVRAARRRFKRS